MMQLVFLNNSNNVTTNNAHKNSKPSLFKLKPYKILIIMYLDENYSFCIIKINEKLAASILFYINMIYSASYEHPQTPEENQ